MPTPRQDIPELAQARAEVDDLHQLYLKGIRQKLKNRVENPNWTVTRIAKRAGMSAKQVSEILNGKASMNLRTLIALAHGAGRAPKDLLPRRHVSADE
jgi:transcriptional regulator with XRE-family HTH domain